jgi:hypothetical protein
MNESTMAPKPKRTGPYKYFVPMFIGGVICKAMVDSGNLWKNVLSFDFLHQLGLTHDNLREVPGIQEVGTAKSGTGLKVLRELKTPIHLQFGGCATQFKCRPVVLEGLSMPFNLSGPFLANLELTSSIQKEHSLYKVRRSPWWPCSTRWPTWSRLSLTSMLWKK